MKLFTVLLLLFSFSTSIIGFNNGNEKDTTYLSTYQNRITTQGIKSSVISALPDVTIDGIRTDIRDTWILSKDWGEYNSSSVKSFFFNGASRVNNIENKNYTTVDGIGSADGIIEIETFKGRIGKPSFRLKATTGYDEAETKFITNDYIKDKLLQNGMYQAYNASVFGGTDFITYNLFGEFKKNQGYIINDDKEFDNYNFGLGTRLNLTNKLKLDITSKYSSTNADIEPIKFLGNIEVGDFNNQAVEDNDSLYYLRNKWERTEGSRLLISANLNYDWSESFNTNLVWGLYTKKNELITTTQVNSNYWGENSTYKNWTETDYWNQTISLTNRNESEFSTFVKNNLEFGFNYYISDITEKIKENSNYYRPGIDDLEFSTETKRLISEGKYEHRQYCLYIDDQLSIGENLEVGAGLRLDYENKCGSHWSYNTNVNYDIFNSLISNKWESNILSGINFNFNFGKRVLHSMYTDYSRFDNFSSFGLNYKINLDLEKMIFLNSGFEFSLLNRSTQLNINYYNRKIDNFKSIFSRDPAAGYSTSSEPAGEVVNKGIEITVSSSIYEQKNFLVNSIISFTTNDNEVSKPEYNNMSLAGLTVIPSKVIKGKSLGVFEMRKPIGNGKSEIVYSDPISPTKFGSIFFEISIHQNLKIAALAEYALGHQFLNLKKLFQYFNGSEELKNIIPEGYNFMTATSVFVEDADWIKLRTVSVSYSFPKQLIKGLTLSAEFNNVAVWGTDSSSDPEINLLGLGGTNFSAPRQFRFGIEYSF